MQTINVSAYGQKLRTNFGVDISSASVLTVALQPQTTETDSLAKTPTLGTTDTVVGDETYLANQFTEYTVVDGDFDDYIGLWRMKSTALISSVLTVTNYEYFRVMA